MAASSPLTLVVVAYGYMDDLAQWFKRSFRGKKAAMPPTPADEPRPDAAGRSD